jgi:hypothetical protein
MMKILTITSARRVKDDTDSCILIDWDTRYISLLEMFSLLRTLEISPSYIRLDRTKRGWHILIPANLPPAERIAAQAILGSDKRREAMNLKRHLLGAYRNLLFEPK